ncbi:hypothetical protein PUN28_010360 [Cardiocondyla obscurior]|uniref:Uncharacterized protein n=1 Tax=Cardiocondyla obscurior TaxID=286306 RepID=A0AAW2FPY1_9HYME
MCRMHQKFLTTPVVLTENIKNIRDSELGSLSEALAGATGTRDTALCLVCVCCPSKICDHCCQLLSTQRLLQQAKDLNCWLLPIYPCSSVNGQRMVLLHLKAFGLLVGAPIA